MLIYPRECLGDRSKQCEPFMIQNNTTTNNKAVNWNAHLNA